MKYSVLTYNINGYEIIHNIDEELFNEMKEDVEFIYVTDDHSITSNTWTVVYDDSLTGSTFDKCYQIRFNPFKYVHTALLCVLTVLWESQGTLSQYLSISTSTAMMRLL